MDCVVCGAQMNAKREWLFNCSSCGFASSSLEAGSGRGIGGLESLRRHNFRKLLSQVATKFSLDGKSLLEVGCAEGWFLDEAKARGMNVIAIEPSVEHADLARSNGFKVLDGFFPDAAPADGKFDFIVFNDVFEHLPEPIEAIQSCEALLKPGGVLVLNLPSNKGIVYRLGSILNSFGMASTLDRLWQKGFPSPHLTYFNAGTLQRFVGAKTKLGHVETFSLDTIVADGLLERIQASHRGIVSWVLYLVVLLALPLVKILPSDIIVGVFQKKNAKNESVV